MNGAYQLLCTPTLWNMPLCWSRKMPLGTKSRCNSETWSMVHREFPVTIPSLTTSLHASRRVSVEIRSVTAGSRGNSSASACSSGSPWVLVRITADSRGNSVSNGGFSWVTAGSRENFLGHHGFLWVRSPW